MKISVARTSYYSPLLYSFNQDERNNAVRRRQIVRSAIRFSDCAGQIPLALLRRSDVSRCDCSDYVMRKGWERDGERFAVLASGIVYESIRCHRLTPFDLIDLLRAYSTNELLSSEKSEKKKKNLRALHSSQAEWGE